MQRELAKDLKDPEERKHWNIHGSDLGREKGDYFDSLKVIGNIHENPELIGNLKPF